MASQGPSSSVIRRTPRTGDTKMTATTSSPDQTGAAASRRRPNIGGAPGGGPNGPSPRGRRSHASPGRGGPPSRRGGAPASLPGGGPNGRSRPRGPRRIAAMRSSPGGTSTPGGPSTTPSGNDHERGPVKARQPARGVLLEIQGRIPLQCRFEFGCDELREVLPDALGLPLLGLHRNPDERRRLRRQHDRQQDDEAEADAPVEAAEPAAAWERWEVRHRRTCSRCPRWSG